MEAITRRHDGEIQELERRGREEVAATVRIHEAAVSESCAAVIFRLAILVTVTKELAIGRFHGKSDFFPNLLGFIFVWLWHVTYSGMTTMLDLYKQHLKAIH